MKLAISSRGGKELDFTGIDFVKTDSVDIVHNLNSYPWPLADNSVDEVNCTHTYSIIKDDKAFMAELYRICKNDAIIKIISPYYTSLSSFSNPDILRRVNEFTFVFYHSVFREAQKLDKLPFDFKVIGHGLQWLNPWEAKSEEAKEYAKTHYWNVVEDIVVHISPIKKV